MNIFIKGIINFIPNKSVDFIHYLLGNIKYKFSGLLLLSSSYKGRKYYKKYKKPLILKRTKFNNKLILKYNKPI